MFAAWFPFNQTKIFCCYRKEWKPIEAALKVARVVLKKLPSKLMSFPAPQGRKLYL